MCLQKIERKYLRNILEPKKGLFKVFTIRLRSSKELYESSKGLQSEYLQGDYYDPIKIIGFRG